MPKFIDRPAMIEAEGVESPADLVVAWPPLDIGKSVGTSTRRTVSSWVDLDGDGLFHLVDAA
jgi:hypothetical protein